MPSHGGKRKGAGRKPSHKEGKRMNIYIGNDHIEICERYSKERKLSQMIAYAIELFKRNQGIS